MSDKVVRISARLAIKSHWKEATLRAELEIAKNGCVAVIEGMDLVMKIESYGTSSGATSKKIVIADSGELPKPKAQV